MEKFKGMDIAADENQLQDHSLDVETDLVETGCDWFLSFSFFITYIYLAFNYGLVLLPIFQ